jgi:antitoxin MazE
MELQCNHVEEEDMNSTSSNIIRIGNSHGVRIPKLLLKQSGIHGEVEMVAKKGEIVIKQKKHPRDGWAERFRKAKALTKVDDLSFVNASGLSTAADQEWKW